MMALHCKASWLMQLTVSSMCLLSVTAAQQNTNDVLKGSFMYPIDLEKGNDVKPLQLSAAEWMTKARQMTSLEETDQMCIGAECAANVLYELYKVIADAVGNPWGECLGAWIAWEIAQPALDLCVANCPGELQDFFRSWMNYGGSLLETFCGDSFRPSPTPPTTPRPTGQRCYKCKKKRSHAECNREIYNCKHNYPYCQTVIYYKKNKIEITKGCYKSCKERCYRDKCYHCCTGDLCNSFITTSTDTPTTTPPPPSIPTENPDCQEDQASECISSLSNAILDAEIGDDDFTFICSVLIAQTQQCIEETTLLCSDKTQRRLSHAFNLLVESIADRCPRCDVLEAENCIQRLRAMLEEDAPWTEICRQKEIAMQCKITNTRSCEPEEVISVEDLWERALAEIGDLCNPKLEIVGDVPSLLAEGGQSGLFDYRATKPPRDICTEPDCRVFVDVVTDLLNKPRCSNRNVISQVVYRTSRPENNVCSREITNNNWQQLQTHEINAKSDMKFDGLQTRNISLSLRVTKDGQTLNVFPIADFPVLAIDLDTNSVCKSINDPHITTFDGHYYNNFNEGYYTLYRHRLLPHEVQVIFQRCNTRASCNCAVAVKSGDSVFVVDRCRRRGDTCNGRNCGGLLRTRHYIWDRITPGTRVFSRNNGRTFEFIFPHGTKVKIQAQGQFVNVWVTAAPADLRLTEGLCGFYDSDRYNDLMLPSGSIYTGVGTGRGQQPRGFNAAWRIPASRRVFSGAPRQPFATPAHCECRPSPHGGAPISSCSYSSIIEMCDFNTNDEITNTLTPQPSSAEAFWKNGQPNLHADEDDDIDVDEDWSAPVSDWPSNGWTEEAARQHCEDFIRDRSEIGQQCDKVPGLSMDDDVDSCVEDIKTTGSSEWDVAALESMKDQCESLVTRNTTLIELSEDMVQDITDNVCINECSGVGECFMGECLCDDGYTSADCSVSENAVPTKVELPIRGLCDKRRFRCEVITVYGESFTDNPDLSCFLQEVKVSTNQTVTTGDPVRVPAQFFSFNQIECSPPEFISYLVAVSNDGANFSEWRIFVPFDSACYICETMSPENAQCIRKVGSHCLIEDNCYLAREENPENACQMCIPEESDSHWRQSDADECRSNSGIIAAITVPVLVVVGGGIVLTVYLHKRRERRLTAKKEYEMRQAEESNARTNLASSTVTPAVHA